ncbi:MAG: replication factor C small subunit [Candidatus Anstonellales archaeon]
MEEILPWTEKYRPKTLSDMIGQDYVVEALKAFVKSRNLPNLLFAGPPGIGKTTATIALAHDLYGEDISGNLLELNASDERGIDVVRGKIKDFARSVAIQSVPFKIIFLDEADALTPDAQHALRRTMERYLSATRFILSCNYSSKIIEPLQSRCSVFRFLPLSDDSMRRMVERISKNEGLTISEEAISTLLYVSGGDMRKAINVLQGVSFQSKKITPEAVYKMGSHAQPSEIRKMIEAALRGRFSEARNMLDELMIKYGMSGEDVILQIYREVPSLPIAEEKKVHLVDRIGEYNFRMVEGANERIQLEALLAQVMLIGKNP